MRQLHGDIPWKSLNGPDILGDDTFRGQVRGESTKIPVGITKRKALLRHLPLSEIASQGNRIKKVTVSYVFQSFSSPSSPNASIGDPFQPWISDKTFGNDDFFIHLKAVLMLNDSKK